MFEGNLFKKSLIFFLIFFLLVLLGALLDMSAQSQEICLVTVDTQTNKNMIIWEPVYVNSDVSYNVLKETSKSGKYEKIGSTVSSNAGKFIDYNSNPSQTANRYKIEVIDSEGKSIDTSNFHQTIHLVLSVGLPGTYNLIWTPYIGFDYDTYYIYKGYSKDKLFLYDSLANTYNQYSDSSDKVTYYQIAVKKANPCYISNLKSGAEPISHSVSNLEDNLKYVDLITKEFVNNIIKVYPNPFYSQLTIEILPNGPEEIKLDLYNNLGRPLYSFSSGSYSSGPYKLVLHEKIRSMEAGFYIVKAVIGSNTYYAKILKNGNK